MGQIKMTAGEIVAQWKGSGPCDIECRLCGKQIATDPPTTLWQGFADGLLKLGIDEHVQCDAIEVALKGSQAALDTFFDSAGIAATDRQRARLVLRRLLANGY